LVWPPVSNVTLGLQPILKLIAGLLAALQIELIGSLLDQLIGSLVDALVSLILFLSRCRFHIRFFSICHRTIAGCFGEDATKPMAREMGYQPDVPFLGWGDGAALTALRALHRVLGPPSGTPPFKRACSEIWGTKRWLMALMTVNQTPRDNEQSKEGHPLRRMVLDISHWESLEFAIRATTVAWYSEARLKAPAAWTVSPELVTGRLPRRQ